MFKWIKATKLWPSGWKIARIIGTTDQMPYKFSANLICDIAGKTYPPDAIEWMYDQWESSCYDIEDIRKAYDAGYDNGRIGLGDEFDLFMKENYNS